MSWGVRQLKGFVIGADESAPKLQVLELVLVENLQVSLSLRASEVFLAC